jgi:chromosome partitioning protein
MAYFLAVANRKGGVGKSTISVMLAHAFAAWGHKKVLLIDLDAQSNSSLILLGGDQWIWAQRNSRNVAAFIEERMYAANPIREFIVENVSDVTDAQGRIPKLSLLPGSLRFEDMQDELITYYSRHNTRYEQSKIRCVDHFRKALALAAPLADIVIMDCAPGLSNATAAALKLAAKVLVPFRPDAVSEFAVDRISAIVEAKEHFEDVLAIPNQNRRYICVANAVRNSGRDQVYIDTISFNHPTLATQIPQMTELADAFDWSDERRPIEEKYGQGVGAVRALYEELIATLSAGQRDDQSRTAAA